MGSTILVVEDDVNINETVSEYLKEAGFLVVSSVDGTKAEEIIQSNFDVDLFILDIMLPGRSGLELLKIIRSMDEQKEKPVLMLTAIGDEMTQLLSFDGLADDYVTKPFSPGVLVKRVNALLRRCRHTSRIMQCGNLVIDLDGYEVLESGHTVNLTLREFELLSALMSSAGKVLSRQQLLNHAWGYDYFGDDRIVDVHIKNLRKKLNGTVIITIKGVGYKLEGTV